MADWSRLPRVERQLPSPIQGRRRLLFLLLCAVVPPRYRTPTTPQARNLVLGSIMLRRTTYVCRGPPRLRLPGGVAALQGRGRQRMPCAARPTSEAQEEGLRGPLGFRHYTDKVLV